jgi:hypothetical protein
MAKNRAEIEIDIQNQGAIASIQAVIGNIQGINRELITAKYGFETAFQTANSIIQATTGQAQQLEKQILGLTGTFASLSQVFSAGVSLNDPLDKINALQPAIEQSIAKVREISLTISGVTSSQLVDVFQTIATNSSQANLSLDQSVQLVKSFSAGLVSANIPLFQQRQEISSILTGQITQDSTLAKQLGVTNEIVAREKARGNLVEYLNDRLKTSVVIQEKFSQTIEGASSNIVEIAELTQSAFGGQLLKPITKILNDFYRFLDTNKDKIFGFAQFLGNQFVEIGKVLQGIFNATFPLLASVGEFLGTLATNQIQGFVDVLQGVGAGLEVSAKVVGAVLIPVFKTLNSDLGQVIVTAGLFAAAVNAGAVGATIKFTESLFALGRAALATVVSSGAAVATYLAESAAVAKAAFAKGGLIAANTATTISYQALLTAQQGFLVSSVSSQGLEILTGGLIAIGVAAAAATVALVVMTNNLEKQNDAAEQSRVGANIAFDSSLKTVAALKKLEEQRIKNGALTKDEEEQQKGLQERAKRNIGLNNQEIESLKARSAKYPELRAQNETQIKLLEKMNEAQSKLQTSGLKVSEIGGSYAFLAQQAKTALNVINAGVNQEDFDKRSKEITDITKQQVELGLITRQQGIEQLEVVAKNENVKIELRAAANKQILALIKEQGKEELELGKQKQAEIEQLAANGFISEGESLKQISELKKEALKIDAENARTANKKILEDSARERASALSKAQKELEELKNTKPTGDIKQDTGTLKAIEDKQNQITKIKSDFDNQDLNNQRKVAGDEAKIRTDKLKQEQDDINKQVKYLRGVLEREQEENSNLRKKAEFATQADIQALKLGGYQNDKQLEEQTLLIKKQTTEAELYDKRRSIEFDKTLLANFRGSQAEKEALIIKISKQETDVAKLNLDLTDNLIARTKILYDAKILAIEQEKDSLDKTSKLLQSQNDLQTARIGLTKAVQDAELKAGETQLNNLKEVGVLLKQNNDTNQGKAKRQADEQLKARRDAILVELSDEEKAAKQKEFQAEDQAKAEADAKSKQAKEDALNDQKTILTKQRLVELGFSAGSSELDIARRTFEQEQKNLELKARQFEANQANEQRSLLISQQQAEIKDRQLATEAKIALLRAQESGKTDLIRSALELVNLTDEQIKNNKELAKIQTDTLNVRQAADREVFNDQQNSASFKTKIAGVESGLTAGQVTKDNAKTQALAVTAAPIASEKAATQTLKKDQDKNVEKVLAERSQILADVADGGRAFEDTSDQVAKNFDKLPKSLKSTADGLKEVIGFAKELSENPIFKSREEAAKKEAENKVKLQQQEAQDKGQVKNVTQTVDNSLAQDADIRAKNRAITANNAKIVDRNNLATAANNFVSDKTSLFGIGNQDEIEATRKANRENDERLKKAKADDAAEAYDRLRSRRKGLFTGGIALSSEPVTVNEQGQEAATNLRTGETTLLPYGERQVVFGDTSYVHNAYDTRQMLAANSQSIVDRNADTIQNYPVLQALGKIHDLIAGRDTKLAVTNNFTNEPSPDQRVYEVARAMMRARAV